MNRAEAEALRERLERAVREGWGLRDPDAQVTTRLRDNNLVDMTVVSALFEGKDGLEREAFFWTVFAPIPRSDLLYMTYCLLLTPEEATRHFAPAPPL